LPTLLAEPFFRLLNFGILSKEKDKKMLCWQGIDHLINFGNLESEKTGHCFGKKSGKSLVFWIQKSVRTQ